jgi:8-oxo-dGTP pyrophosphatase MutT (NUDIX family)
MSGEAAARRQYAALPWRRANGLEVLLVTSRETRRWVIPKGWPMADRTGPEAAAQEAFEEAGVTGQAAEGPAGAFRYRKRLKTGDEVDCEVFVFPLRVDEEHEDWPERLERERQWFTPAAAAAAVEEDELKGIILSFSRAPSGG